MKFRNQKVWPAISFLIGMGMANIAWADNSSSDSGAKAISNHLASFQISCFTNSGGAQSDSDPNYVGKLINLAGSNKPEDRISALSQLAVKNSIDPGIVQRILQAAISDSDAKVRGQAVYAIAQQDCQDALLVLEQAMHDPELSVRLLAIDGLGSDDKSVALLEQALGDEDAAIRELAALKLELLSDPNKTASDEL